MDSLACLDDDTVNAFARGELSAAERERAERHLDGCAPCRQLVSALAQFSSDVSSPSTESDKLAVPRTRLERGAVLGRFVVLAHIGSGGMGTVYAAYDPELDRKVALKLLHEPAAAGSAGERSPLLREAQAMARVAHPNVVTVHDVGTVDERIFIAMEFVEGKSLRAWLAAEKRPWRRVVAAYLEAGRGLAAAHDAGIVHRDFKPDNVLVGRDGRARVTDFGLAHVEGVRHDPGTIVGTPAYMSPEQRRGADADARSDQFSFCVALYQALDGELPLDGRSASSRIPGPLRNVLLRGLSHDPARRYRSMADLLAELESAPRRAKVRWLGAAAITGIALVALGVGYRTRVAREALCAGSEEHLRGVWDGPKKATVLRRFEASQRPFAKDAWSTVERVLDAYATEWVAARRSSCEATRLRGEQTEETFALRTACLDRRLDEMNAIASLFAQADDTVVEHAAGAARKLTPVIACEPGAALTMQPMPPVDPVIRHEVEKVRLELDEARVLMDSGKFAAGLPIADAAVAAANKLAHAPLVAEAYYLQGALRDQVSDAKGAEESLYEAATAAETARHDRISAQAWALLVLVVGYRQAKHDTGYVLVRPARAAILRVGEAPELAAPFENNLGTLSWTTGKYPEARAHYEKAASLWEKAFGSEHPFVADALNNEGLVLWNQGKYEASLAVHQRALAIRRKLLGDEHPVVASSLNNVGLVHYSLFRFAESADHHRRAVAIQERALGPSHPLTANSLNNLGLAELAEGKNQEALDILLRAFDVRKKSRPAEHQDIANSQINLAMAYDALENRERALQSIEAGHALQLHLLGANHPDLAETSSIYASILRRAGKVEQALERAERAVAIAEKAFTADHPILAMALGELGQCQLAAGEVDRALVTLERAVDTRKKQASDPIELGTLSFARARALWQKAQDRPTARRLLTEAREALAAGGPRGAARLREADAWLAANVH